MNISEDDLIEFHKIHFGFIPDRRDIWEELVEEEEEEEVIYYPDGVIRTITDEQIEFFRSSEIRQRERDKEREKDLKRKVDSESIASDGHADFHNGSTHQPLIPQNTFISIEETKPYTPIHSNPSNYSHLFGCNESYIQKLDDQFDTEFINVCRKNKVQHYYPVLPL